MQSFNCCADTFFSALVTETAALDGELCSRFIEAVQNGGLLFSDFLPYYSGAEEELYVPVPYHCKEKLNPLDLQLSFKELCLQYEALRDHENMAYIRVSAFMITCTRMKARLKSRKSTILAGAAYSAGLISETADGILCKQLYFCGRCRVILHSWVG